jgi:hypothetical protein
MDRKMEFRRDVAVKNSNKGIIGEKTRGARKKQHQKKSPSQ